MTTGNADKPYSLRLENDARWPDILAAVLDRPVAQVASELGIPEGEIRGALRRRTNARKRIVRRQDLPDEPTAIEVPEAQKPVELPKRQHRTAKVQVKVKVKAETKTKTKTKTKTRSNPLLEPFKHRVGTLPDTALAELAGVSMWVVRHYRLGQGISTFRAERPKTAVAPAVSRVVKHNALNRVASNTKMVSVPVPVQVPVPTETKPRTTLCWRITLIGGDERLALGDDLVEVGAKVVAAGLGDVEYVERFGVVLVA